MAKKSTKFDHNTILPAEVAEKFVVKLLRETLATKIHFPKYGIVDFKNLSLKRAQHLVNLGAEFIAPKPNAKQSEQPN